MAAARCARWLHGARYIARTSGAISWAKPHTKKNFGTKLKASVSDLPIGPPISPLKTRMRKCLSLLRKTASQRPEATWRSFRPSSHRFPKRPGPVAPRIKAGLGDISSRFLGTGSAKDRLKAHQFVPMDPQLPGLNSFALHTAGPVQRRRPQALSLGRIFGGRRYPPNGLESTIATCHPAARHFDAAADAPDPVRIATRSKFFFIISLRLPLSPLRANAWHVETNSIKSGLCAHIQGLTVLIAPRHVVRVFRPDNGPKMLA